MQEKILALVAPLSGILVPLADVPDPVFAAAMVGDGLAIDPVSNVLVAPIKGEVIQLHPAGHALGLRSEDGLELLLHIGIDTVKLKGEGFSPKVALGSQVDKGDVLIEFDADLIACKAKSLLSMLVITQESMVSSLRIETGRVEAGKTPVAQVTLAAPHALSDSDLSLELASETIVIVNPTGLHARPSATLANLAKRFQATITLQKGARHANARSIVALMGLEVGCGDKVQLLATGVDAQEALAKIVPELRAGLGEDGVQVNTHQNRAENSPIRDSVSKQVSWRSGVESLLVGVGAAPGLVVGRVFQWRFTEFDGTDLPVGTPGEESELLKAAIDASALELAALVTRLETQDDLSKAAIFRAHQELLDDPELLDLAQSSVAKGLSAFESWKRAYTLQSDRLSQLKNRLLAERASDLRDVGRRVLSKMLPEHEPVREVPDRSILIAEDLTPSEVASFDRSRILGLATTAGGATSHVAILARAWGLAAVVGIEERALDLADGSEVVLSGDLGKLKVAPSKDLVAQVVQAISQAQVRCRVQAEAAHSPAYTTDGCHIEVGINIGGASEARQATEQGADGVGLLRSEFLFLERAFAPTEEEQGEAYIEAAQALGQERKLVIRTLDVGGDKPLAYLPLPQEDNPFLGQRGVRVSLARPELFRPQLRAILKASAFAQVHVMFPMITTIEELRACKAILREEETRLGLPSIPVGVMIEVPAAALSAHLLAKEVDFFSIGTNDLTQYTLAMDRGHPQLAACIDGLEPSVLRLIELTCRAAIAYGRPVGVCGGLAGEPEAIPILLGLGVRELSVSLPLMPAVKARVREFSLTRCQELANVALAADNARAVRALCVNPWAREVSLL